MRRLISLLTTTTLITGLVALVAPTQAAAHGSMDNPASRVYMCKFVTPDDPRCQAAREANPQSLYDWMEVNIGDAAGRHRDLIPDGKLCSANRAKYAYFDEPGTDWPATPLKPDADGNFTVRILCVADTQILALRFVQAIDHHPICFALRSGCYSPSGCACGRYDVHNYNVFCMDLFLRRCPNIHLEVCAGMLRSLEAKLR